MGLNVYSILLPPYVAVTLAGEIANVTFVQRGYDFGVVDSTNPNGFAAVVGDTYLFKREDAVLLTAGGIDYYIIKEKDLLSQNPPNL